MVETYKKHYNNSNDDCLNDMLFNSNTINRPNVRNALLILTKLKLAYKSN